MARLPKRIYRITVNNRGESGYVGSLRWSEVGSKTYNSRAEALKRLDNLRSRGIDCDLFESEELHWTKISEDD